jgi:ADP-ribose pyrophosphatase
MEEVKMYGYKEKLDHKVINKGNMIDFCIDTIKLPNDKIYTREFVIHPGAVAILAFVDENHIILENNYRYPFNQTMIEVPAGKLEKDEEPLTACVRELEEETGYHASKVVNIGRMLPVSAYSTEILHFYIASNLTKTKTHLDEDEMLETFVVSFKEAVDMIKNGIIDDAKTIAIILKAKLLIENGLAI